MIEQLVTRVFQIRNAAHLAHWAAQGEGSFARHMALDGFYSGLIPQIDEIVEAYQGTKGLIKINGSSEKMLPYIQDEAKWIAANREELAGGVPSVLNMIDDLHGIYSTAAYKLRFLK